MGGSCEVEGMDGDLFKNVDFLAFPSFLDLRGIRMFYGQI